MTFGSGSNGCLGHGNLTDISQVGIMCTLERRSERGALSRDWGQGSSQKPHVPPAPRLHLFWVSGGGGGEGKYRKLPRWRPTCCCDCELGMCACAVGVKETVIF